MRTVVILATLAVLVVPAAATGQTAADNATARRISNHLEQSGLLRNYLIGVAYQDGVATLSGTVASAEQRETAIRLAEQVAGVSRVRCELKCSEPASVSQPRSVAGAFDSVDRVTPASAQSPPYDIVQAYGVNRPAAAPPQARPPMPPRMAPHRHRPMPRGNMPLPAPRPMPMGVQQASHGHFMLEPPCPDDFGAAMAGPAMPMGHVPHAHARGPAYESAHLPAYAWPSYASYPNYAALTYPRQYSPTAWPYIGPFYPYPQVPLAWRKVSLEWDDGWWFLDFSAHNTTK